MFPRHPRHTQSGLFWLFCAFDIHLDLLKWIERGHRCKRVLFLGSEMLRRMWCSDMGRSRLNEASTFLSKWSLAISMSCSIPLGSGTYS